MANINIHFYGIPRKLAREFAKLVGGSVVETPPTFTWIAIEDENAPHGIHIEIDIHLDTPKNTRYLNLEHENLLLRDDDAGLRIYKSPKRQVCEPFYTVLVQHIPTPLQICEHTGFA